MFNPTLKDFMDNQALQQFQQNFYNATGICIYTVDTQSIVASRTGRNEFCSDKICKSELGSAKCSSCCQLLKDQAFRTCRPTFSQCVAGLTECAVPFVYNGNALGALIIGPVIYEKPDDAYLRNVAREYRIDENGLVLAAKSVKVIPKKQFEATAEFLFSIVSIMCERGKQSIIAHEKMAALKIHADKIKQSLDNAEKLLGTNDQIVKELSKDFDELNRLSEVATQQLDNTNETVKVIQNIAMNTRILGFNASIEASRAKESGKGFGVIAQEVRSLADVSKASAEKIEEIVDNISDITKEIRSTVLDTSETVKSTFNNMNNMSTLLEEMRAISKDLN